MSTPRILIVDDDPDFVEATKVLFEASQYAVSAAYDPEEGFAKLEDQMPDVLILDIMMGKGADGFLVARKIRKDPRFDKMPILMLTSMREQTGFDFPGQRIHPKFLPVDDYIEKGVDPKVLLDKVAQQLASRAGNG